MPLTDPVLWERIHAMRLPKGPGGRSFAATLARSEKITENTARLAVEEYRRFLYLTALGRGRTVPSEAVDLVWHQHLKQGAVYADALTRVIGRPIRHEPGRPKGHAADYQATRALYHAEFDMLPPVQFWPREDRLLDWMAILLVGTLMPFILGALAGDDAPFAPVFRLLVIGVALAFALPPILRLTGLRRDRPLRDRTRGDFAGGGDGSADCGGASCGGD